MRGSSRSDSPCSETVNNDSACDSNILRRTRRRLQERFEECRYDDSGKQDVDKSWNSFTLPTVGVSRIHPARVLRSGANTLTRTLNSMQTTFGTLSQKFRRSTKRRHQFKNEMSSSPITPLTRSRHILGRTPTKLYSPFGIESPCKKMRDKENGERNDRISENQRIASKELAESTKCIHKCTHAVTSETMILKNKNFDPDMEEVRIGVWELRETAQTIVKRSLQH